MKLRSLQEFEDAIDRETAWRKRELTTILSNARTARDRLQDTALRSGVALLYAHWEGWIKRVAECYIEFVAQQRLTYEQLSTPFLALALRARVNHFGETGTPRIHLEFAEFLRGQLPTRAKLNSKGMIRTEANLSSSVLREIVTALGLDHTPYALNERLIDQRMLDRRNHVAHGEYLELSLLEFETLHAEVFGMLQAFTGAVRNEAALGAFRATA